MDPISTNVTRSIVTSQALGKPAEKPAVTAKARPTATAQAEQVDAKEAVAQAASSKAKALEQALEKINEQAGSLSPALKFEPDSETGVVVIKVLNRSTGEVIRQLPPEAVVDAALKGDDALPALIETSA